MKKFLVTAFVLAGLTGFARADDAAPAPAEPKFFLNEDGSVTRRLEKIESDTAKLDKRVAALERAAGTTARPIVNPTAPAAPSKVRFSVCTKGVCTIHECDTLAQVPAGATILSGLLNATAAGSPCPTGPCGDNCGCAGTASGASFTETASTGRTGLFQRFRDRRASRGAGGGCASCGQ